MRQRERNRERWKLNIWKLLVWWRRRSCCCCCCCCCCNCWLFAAAVALLFEFKEGDWDWECEDASKSSRFGDEFDTDMRLLLLLVFELEALALECLKGDALDGKTSVLRPTGHCGRMRLSCMSCMSKWRLFTVWRRPAAERHISVTPHKSMSVPSMSSFPLLLLLLVVILELVVAGWLMHGVRREDSLRLNTAPHTLTSSLVSERAMQ